MSSPMWSRCPALVLLGLLVGCTNSAVLMQGPPPAGIRHPLPPPQLPPPLLPGELPESPPGAPSETPRAGERAAAEQLPAPAEGPEEIPLPAGEPFEVRGTLELAEVLESVDRAFPLLLAAEQERAAAAGRRLAAEGAFDLNLRAQGNYQEGSFSSDRFDFAAEQPTPWHGASFYGGYRFGFGEFPVYYGNRLTADGGEFRGGLMLPLLRDGEIDRRRALLRQMQYGEPLTEAAVRGARIDYFRAAAHRYWNWVVAGGQYEVAASLLRIASERQAGLEEQFRQGQVAEFVVVDNRRLIVEREGLLVAAERRWQQAALELSLYLRDEAGEPVLPRGEWLPRLLFEWEPAPPATDQLRGEVELAFSRRPEMLRFQLQKAQAALEVQLADNQTLPAVNMAVGGTQDVGKGKKGEGIFQADRTSMEASLLVEVPLQRREALGKLQTARAGMRQLLAQERFTRDQIAVQVQDAVSNLDRSHARWLRAREEQRIARQVTLLELDRFEKGQGTLLEVNLRELAAAAAQSKVLDALAEFFRAEADYRAALGIDTPQAPPQEEPPPEEPPQEEPPPAEGEP